MSFITVSQLLSSPIVGSNVRNFSRTAGISFFDERAVCMTIAQITFFVFRNRMNFPIGVLGFFFH